MTSERQPVSPYEVIDTALTQFGSRDNAAGFILSALKEAGYEVVKRKLKLAGTLPPAELSRIIHDCEDD